LRSEGSARTGVGSQAAACAYSSRLLSNAFSITVVLTDETTPSPRGGYGRIVKIERSMRRRLHVPVPTLHQQSTRPTMSSSLRKPRSARPDQVSATKKQKLIRARLSWKLLPQFGSCVATPTGQVFKWHLRIMMQPWRPAEWCEANSSDQQRATPRRAPSGVCHRLQAHAGSQIFITGC